jgi:hypothetical protein
MEPRERTPEQRKYDREAKQRSRAKEKAERLRSMVPLARNYKIPEEQQKKFSQYSRDITKAVQADLNLEKLLGTDEYIVDAVACVLLGLENNFTQTVSQPDGMLIGGWFPDAAASETIQHVHRFPRLLQSTVFADLYSKFIKSVAKWTTKNEHYSEREFVQDINREVAGTYVLRPLPEPKPEPKKIPEVPSVPSDVEILKEGRIKLSHQLQTQFRIQDPTVPKDALKYLNGDL